MSSPQRTEEKQASKDRRERGRRETLTDWARAQAGAVLTPIARGLAKLGIHPNTITIIGMLLQVGVGAVFATGRITLGGWLLVIVGPLDALDGSLARALGRKSEFGAFLDSTMDRLSDAALISGILIWFVQQGALPEVVLLLIALVSAMWVSYIRARAEALGLSCKVGLLTRLERVTLIIVLAVLGQPTVLAWALAVLSVFTAVQRIVHVYRVFEREGDPV
ncbi:MAG: CDP-alcohol phosphatidyltransferase family protein [Anaerolineales bacterium]|nr:MAG: CDP-alcohol phosphatidyltransferase family protein [Anaerolineales bacterium]